MNLKPWSHEEARTIAMSAHRTFYGTHHHASAKSIDCSTCCLNGNCAINYKGTKSPNFAGWGRIYVEAGVPIPKRFARAFANELASDNDAYRTALLRSIATFGLSGTL